MVPIWNVQLPLEVYIWKIIIRKLKWPLFSNLPTRPTWERNKYLKNIVRGNGLRNDKIIYITIMIIIIIIIVIIIIIIIIIIVIIHFFNAPVDLDIKEQKTLISKRGWILRINPLAPYKQKPTPQIQIRSENSGQKKSPSGMFVVKYGHYLWISYWKCIMASKLYQGIEIDWNLLLVHRVPYTKSREKLQELFQSVCVLFCKYKHCNLF